MIATGAEASLLFTSHKILANPVPAVFVVFPMSAKPDPTEIHFLKTIFPAMGWQPWQIRYQFSDDNLNEGTNQFLAMLEECPLVLFFGFSGVGEEQPITEKKEGGHFIFLPQLHKIQSNLPLKTAVWLALKPHSAA